MKRFLVNIVPLLLIATLLFSSFQVTHVTAASSGVSPCSVQLINGDNVVSQALANGDIKALQDFFAKQGYSVVSNMALTSFVQCGEKDAVTIVLLPIVVNESQTLFAHIAYWKGNWGSRSLEGALALVESDQDFVYVYNDKKEVVSLAKGNWSKKAKLSFDEIGGLGLPLKTNDDVTEQNAGIPNNIIPATTYCRSVNIARTHYTTLGFVAYKFHQTKYWCYNGSTVSNVNVNVYLSNVDPNYYYRGIVSQWDVPRSGSHDSMRQGQFDNCILQYGCIGTSYPAVQIVANANGSYGYSTWE